MHACMCVSFGGETGREENGCRTRDKTVVITETRAFGFSVLRGSIICNRETVGQKTCAIKKVVAFEAVNDSMVHRCLNERRAYKGRGSIGGWNCGVFRLACSKSLAEATNDKDNRYFLLVKCYYAKGIRENRLLGKAAEEVVKLTTGRRAEEHSPLSLLTGGARSTYDKHALFAGYWARRART